MQVTDSSQYAAGPKTPPVLVPEVMANQLTEIADTSLAKTLADAFVALFAEADQWKNLAMKIVVTNADQTIAIQQARSLRLQFRRIRCDAETRRKALKAGIVAQGKAIDGMANIIKALTEPVEAHLQAQEDFAERMEAEAAAKLFHARALELAEFGVADPSAYNLGIMPADQYAALYDALEGSHKARVEAARVAAEVEAKRVADEAAERERLRVENAALRAEQDRKDAAHRADSAAAAEVARKDRVAREQAEAELREKLAREDAAAEQVRRDKAAAEAAPDKAKLDALAAAIRALKIPALTSPKAQHITTTLTKSIENFAKLVNQLGENL